MNSKKNASFFFFMKKTERRNQKQDIKGDVDENLKFKKTTIKKEKKDKITIKYLEYFKYIGVKDIIDVAGTLKYNGKHEFTVNEMANIIFKFDEFIHNKNKKYEPHNKRMVKKGSQNVKNIIFTKYCLEMKDEFLDFLKNYDEMPEFVVKQIESQIPDYFTHLIQSSDNYKIDSSNVELEKNENQIPNAFIDLTQSSDHNKTNLSDAELEKNENQISNVFTDLTQSSDDYKTDLSDVELEMSDIFDIHYTYLSKF